MDCPKCGFAQDDGREDCISCGIVFARFREAQERAQMFIAQNSVPPPSPSEGIAVSRWMVLAFVLFVIVVGALWTKSRRDARTNRDLRKEGMARLNEINKESVKTRQRLEKEQQSAQELAAAMAETPKSVQRPVGLDESGAQKLIEQCFGFQERKSIMLPKYIPGYPNGVLALALDKRILERVGNESRLWPGPGAGGMAMFDKGEEYEIVLGLRRVKEITELGGGVDHATAKFRWMYEGRVAAETLLTGETFTGVAIFIHKGGAWRVNGASVWSQDGDATRVCKDFK